MWLCISEIKDWMNYVIRLQKTLDIFGMLCYTVEKTGEIE